jgi:hypothetical protein
MKLLIAQISPLLLSGRKYSPPHIVLKDTLLRIITVMMMTGELAGKTDSLVTGCSSHVT